MHLTNVAVQKHTEEYNRETGGKWSIHEIKRYLTAKHGEETANRAFSDVQDVMIHSLECVQDVIQNDKQCFELYVTLCFRSCLILPICNHVHTF